jgi:hypothetical protein
MCSAPVFINQTQDRNFQIRIKGVIQKPVRKTARPAGSCLGHVVRINCNWGPRPHLTGPTPSCPPSKKHPRRR